MSTALQMVNNKEISFHEQQNRENNMKKLLKDSFAKGATDEELALFTQVCLQQNLDPIKKQIYFMKIYDSNLRREVFSPAVSIDGLRSKAEETGLYAGQTIPLFCGKDGIWKEIWFDKDPPVACKVGVYRKDFKEPLFVVAMWDAFAKKKKEGGYTKFWAEMGPLMLAKCAEALALRKAFPAKLSGLYTSEELDRSTIDADYSKEEFKNQAQRIPQNIQTQQKVQAVAQSFDLANEFEQKRGEISQELNKLYCEEVGKFDVDNQFKTSFFEELLIAAKKEYVDQRGNLKLEDFFKKALLVKRINFLALAHNAIREPALNEIELKDLKTQVYKEALSKPDVDLPNIFSQKANSYITI